jgi:probable rRNA maturation factor
MIEVNNTTRRAVDEVFLKKVGERVLREEKAKNADVSVVIVGAKRMQELNRRYRKKDKVANVLSFSVQELGLGEVVLCPQEVKKDAKKYGMIFEKAFAWMLVHGILHLLGYSHKEMEKREERYLKLVS